jgi:hypothetical protein
MFKKNAKPIKLNKKLLQAYEYAKPGSYLEKNHVHGQKYPQFLS